MILEEIPRKLFVVLSFVFSGAVAAGDFFERNGLALGGIDPITFFDGSGPRQGIPSIQATFKGSIFLFTSEAHRERFLASPEKLSPQFNGFCAFGTAGEYKAKTEPEAYTVVDGQLYFNYDLGVQKKWRRDRDALIKKAQLNWPSVMKTTRVYQ